MAIKIFTSPTCPHSEQAKKLFKKKKLKFEEVSLFKNENGCLEMIELSGQMATPVILIDEEIFIGFDEPLLKNILKEKRKAIRKDKKN